MLEFKESSHRGSRKLNEDFTGAVRKDAVWCFALADGLGGEGKGNLASSLAVERVLRHFQSEGECTEECLKKCFELAQECLLNKQREMHCPNEMKTTLVVLLTDGKRALWGHSGDSRLYYIKRGEKILHTRDHSVPQMLVAMGEIEEKDIRGHEDRNRLLKAIGVAWSSKGYEISKEIDWNEDDCFLLCSDGFWEAIDERQMLDALKSSSDMEQWMKRMEEKILDFGKKKELDNYSAVAVGKRR